MVTNVGGLGDQRGGHLLVVVPVAACAAAADGLVGWWPGDGSANDMVGNNNGTLQGGATASAAGIVGPAFSFDGTNGYVQIPDSPALKPANLTIEAWVQLQRPGFGAVGHRARRQPVYRLQAELPDLLL